MSKTNGIPKGATHIVTLPDGTSAGRKTDRGYTHAIAFKNSDRWEVHYCGSALLAQKSLASAPGWQSMGAVILPVERVSAT